MTSNRKKRRLHRIKSKQHAISRAKERHGIDFTHEDIEAMSKIIREGKYEVQVKRSKFILNYKGHNLYVTFNGKVDSINTVLNKEQK